MNHLNHLCDFIFPCGRAIMYLVLHKIYWTNWSKELGCKPCLNEWCTQFRGRIHQKLFSLLGIVRVSMEMLLSFPSKLFQSKNYCCCCCCCCCYYCYYYYYYYYYYCHHHHYCYCDYYYCYNCCYFFVIVLLFISLFFDTWTYSARRESFW